MMVSKDQKKKPLLSISNSSYHHNKHLEKFSRKSEPKNKYLGSEEQQIESYVP